MNKTCFVIMPFAENYKQVYDHGIEPAVKYFGYRCVRADDPYGPRNIVKDIIEYLYYSDFIIADISDFNPNVFYELGISHCMGNKTILICNEKSNKPPFDLSNYHIIFYKESIDGIREVLKEELKATINNYDNWINKPNNPVQNFLPDINLIKTSDCQIYIAGEDIVYGNAVRLKSDEKVYRAIAHQSDKGTVVGIVIENARYGFPCKVQKTGIVKYENKIFTAGEKVHLRNNENGINLSMSWIQGKSEIEDISQVIGIGNSSNSIDIKIGTSFIMTG
ncbi:MAG: hypothetical protein ABSG15_13510 [FCB group bacterium]